MNCDSAKDLIHPYADGELDLVNTLDVENHLRDCPACAASHRSLMTLRGSLRDGSLYFRAPGGLEQQIRAQVRQARSAASGRTLFIGRWSAAAAAFVALLAGTAVFITLRNSSPSPEKLLATEVTTSHIRSLMAEHLWDVKSTDQHTVKPWFDGKLDFAPEVRDFKAESFALEGGRLDYLAGRPVAALIYRHEKHLINLFIWPAPGRPDQADSAAMLQGYELVHWVHGGMNYWVVSDMSDVSLRRLASLLRSAG